MNSNTLQKNQDENSGNINENRNEKDDQNILDKVKNLNELSVATTKYQEARDPNYEYIDKMKKYLSSTTNLIHNQSSKPPVINNSTVSRSKVKKDSNARLNESRVKEEFKDINEQQKSLCRMDKRKEHIKKSDKISQRKNVKSAIESQSDLSYRSKSSDKAEKKHRRSLHTNNSNLSYCESRLSEDRSIDIPHYDENLYNLNKIESSDIKLKSDIKLNNLQEDQNNNESLNLIMNDTNQKDILSNDGSCILNKIERSLQEDSSFNNMFNIISNDHNESTDNLNISINLDESRNNINNVQIQNCLNLGTYTQGSEERKTDYANDPDTDQFSNRDLVKKVINSTIHLEANEIEENKKFNQDNNDKNEDSVPKTTKEDFSKLLNDMKSKAYKNSNLDMNNEESTRMNDTNDFREIDVKLEKGQQDDNDIKMLRKKFKGNYSCMPSIFLSAINGTNKIKMDRQKDPKVIKKKKVVERDIHKEIFDKAHLDPKIDMVQKINAAKKNTTKKVNKARPSSAMSINRTLKSSLEKIQ